MVGRDECIYMGEKQSIWSFNLQISESYEVRAQFCNARQG